MPRAASGRDLARAHSWKPKLDYGRYASISEMTAAERIDSGYLGRILVLTLLAPDIVEAILDGRQPPELGLQRLMEPILADWLEQRRPRARRSALPAGPVPSADRGRVARQGHVEDRHATHGVALLRGQGEGREAAPVVAHHE
jgi:hypothetical protein